MTINSLSFSNIFLQEMPINHLASSFRSGRISQTYLFTGAKSVGKNLVARTFAGLMQCIQPNTPEKGVQEPCGICENCKRIVANSHPDVETISPIGNDIRIDQVRELRDAAYLKPSLGRWRVYIIDPADKLNISSSNAILKILEEAPKHVVFILLATDTDAVLPTILSRSEVVRFQSPSFNEARQILQSKMNLSATDASICLSLTEGNFGQALKSSLDFTLPDKIHGIKHSHTRFLIDLERYSEHIANDFENVTSLDQAIKKLDEFTNYFFMPLQVSRKELCRSLLMQSGLPAAFPILFTKEFTNRLEISKKRIKKTFDTLLSDSKTSYSSSMLKNIEKQFNSELNIWVTKQFSNLLSCLLHWYEDVLRWFCTKDKTLLLNLEQKEDIIIVTEVDEVVAIQSAISLINESLEMLKMHIQPTLVFENVLTQIGGLA